MYRISVEYAWDTHGICTGYATNMLRICIYIHYNPWALYPYSLRYIVSPEPPLRYTSNSEQPAPELHLLLSKSRPLRFVHILKNTFPLNLIWGTQIILGPRPDHSRFLPKNVPSVKPSVPRVWDGMLRSFWPQTLLREPHAWICCLANPVHCVLFISWSFRFPSTSSEVHK